MDQPTQGPRPDPVLEPAVSARPPSTPIPGEALDSRVVPYWLATGLVSALVLGGVVLGGLLAFGERLPMSVAFSWSLAAILVGSQLVWALISPGLAHRAWRFSIDDALLVARFGIVFRQEKVIPTNRLQHVDLMRGPIERLFGLATLVVHTAGTEAVAFRLPGLAVARANELRDRILSARGVDVV